MTILKISCPSCPATYNIPDEKIPAKGAKIKCKKCDGQIVIPPQTEDSNSKQAPVENVQPKVEEVNNVEKPTNETTSDDNTKLIDGLDVSDAWKRKLKLMDDITPEKYILLMRSKDAGERKQVGKHFNWLATIFGSFYYFYNKMWKKGFLLLSLTLLLSSLDTFFFMMDPTYFEHRPLKALMLFVLVVIVIPSIFTGKMANYDFYMLKIRNISMWEKFKPLLSSSINVGIVFSLVFTLWVVYGFSDGYGSDIPECNELSVTNLVEEITNGEMAKRLKIDKSKTNELFSYSVDDIKTTNTNDETGKKACSATLFVQENKNNESTPIPITYIVKGIEGSDQISVNVFGL